jgi:hypothetical protein
MAWQKSAIVGAAISALLAIVIWLIPESPALDQPKVIEQESLLDKQWIWQMIVIVCISFFQQTTGISSMIESVSYRFEGTSFDIGGSANAIAALAHIVSTLIGAFAIEAIGRRIVWFISLLGISISSAVYVVLLGIDDKEGDEVPWYTLLDIFLFFLAYGLGAGPIPWFLAAEGFPLNLRPIAGAIMAASNWIFAFLALFEGAAMDAALTAKGSVSGFAVLSFLGAFFGLAFIKNPEPPAQKQAHRQIYDDLG